jgi:ATP-dependent Lhr-like helicase
VEARDLGRLDPDAIERVRQEVRPDPRDADELHDLLMTVVGLRPIQDWIPWFDELVEEHRALTVYGASAELWCALERRPAMELLFPEAVVEPDHRSSIAAPPIDRDAAAAEMLRGHLEYRGPSTVLSLADATGLPESEVAIAVARLEGEGFAFRGHFSSPDGPEEFCARRLLARIHGYTQQRLRREIEPVTARTSCGSSCGGSTRRQVCSAKGALGCWPWSNSSRGSRWRQGPGRTRSCAPEWRAIGGSGSTTSVSPAR